MQKEGLASSSPGGGVAGEVEVGRVGRTGRNQVYWNENVTILISVVGARPRTALGQAFYRLLNSSDIVR
jgi:hypothetical protein